MGGLKPYYYNVKRQQKKKQLKQKSKPSKKGRTALILGLIGLLVVINLHFNSNSNNQQQQRARRSLSCITGSLRSALIGRRILCEVESVLADGSFGSAFGEPAPSPPTVYSPTLGGDVVNATTNNTTVVVADEAGLPDGGDDNIAFVVTISSCPEDAIVDESSSSLNNATTTADPGDNFYDAAAVLRDSVCNCTATNPDSGSNYNSTMYAVIHPDAIHCDAPVSGDGRRRRRLQSTTTTTTTVDRIKILEELGYYPIVWREPELAASTSDTVSNKMDNVRELMNLYAYNLTNHPVSVMVAFDTVFTAPIDAAIDELLHAADSGNKKAKFSRRKNGKVNPGIVFVKPDTDEFQKVVDIISSTEYNETRGGWGDSGIVGTNLESILTYVFDSDTTGAYEEVPTETMQKEYGVVNFGSNDACGEPWDCKVDSDWDESTKRECTALNQVWYRQRKSFEGRWSKKAVVDTTKSTYHTDMFMGYCTEGGEYVRASDFSATKVYSCDDSVNTGTSMVLSDYSPQLNTLGLTTTTGTGQVCLLSLVSNHKSIPIARSYDGGDWEASGGFLASRLNAPTCSDDDARRTCTFANNGLPPQEAGESYVLSYYEHNGFGPDAEAARFLEQTTFGGNKEDIASIRSSTNNYEAWLTEQMSPSIMTSHREYFRRRLNKDSEYSSYHSGPGPWTPCDSSNKPNIQWRSFALSERDGITSHQSDISKYLSVREQNGVGTGGPYLWLVEGMVRTVTAEKPVLKNSQNEYIEDLEMEPTYYEIEFGVGNSYKWNCLGCLVKLLKHNRDGSHGIKAYVNNPRVDLVEGMENDPDLVPYNIITLPNRDQLVSVDDGDEYRNHPIGLGGIGTNWYATFNQPGEEFYIPEGADTAPLCDPNQYPILSAAGYTHLTKLNSTVNPGVSAARHVATAFPPIFGKTLNTITQQYELLLLSPKLYLPENTPHNPLLDGGKLIADASNTPPPLDTANAGAAVTKCSNAPRNFLNEKQCILSTDACANNPLSGSVNGPHAVVVCGSIGEVSNDPTSGGGARSNAYDFKTDFTGRLNRNIGSFNDPYIQYKTNIWTNIVLNADDQLRQRVAWALYQLIPIGVDLTFSTSTGSEVEGWMQYYDIFVRNAFGNFRDILKQISYNGIMSKWLSFTDNKSIQYDLDVANGVGAFPDENYAREIMQLFSIGIYKLEMNGAIALNTVDGSPVLNYDNDDLMSMARSWTGFVAKDNKRGNTHGSGVMSVDPMKIQPEYRDVFPKSDLMGGYIGDGYPLCTDLPDRPHFRKGAVYRLLGSRWSPEKQKTDLYQETFANLPEIVLTPGSSPLYTQLCAAANANTDGAACTFPGYVELTENLDYSSATALPEYDGIETFRTVKVQSSPFPVYYEYVRPPCVEHHFFNDGRKAIAGHVYGNQIVPDSICVDPRSTRAGPGCCRSDWDQQPGGLNILGTECKYYGERLSFEANTARCASVGRAACHPRDVEASATHKSPAAEYCSTNRDISKKNWYSWTTAGCQTKVKLSYPGDSDGVEPTVARVDGVDPDYAGMTQTSTLVQNNTVNFYKVAWIGDNDANTNAPHNAAACDAVSTCQSMEDGCLCDALVINDNSAVFTSSADIVSKTDILTYLHTGAFATDMYDAGVYTSLGNCGIDGVEIYASSSNSCTNLGPSAVFVVTDDNTGVVKRRRNVQSTVQIRSLSLSFRNPVHFISMHDPDVRDMEYETDAVLDHLFYHPSHAPFLALRMIQRFGNSNPSPGLVERVARAYQTGMYGGFGSGNYGDLGAMMASIVLDTESRSVSLDADPNHGQIREPILKVTGYLRSLKGIYRSPGNWGRLYKTGIGQDPYGAESVFSFFLPEFEPAGIIGDSGLVSPEAGALAGSKITNLLDGLLATSKFGLTNCRGGIVAYYSYNGCPAWEGDFTRAEGYLEYVPPDLTTVDSIIDDLSLLLTAGRLGAPNRAIIKSVVLEAHQYGSTEKALRIAQQLIAMTPEYHTNALQRKDVVKREITGYENDPVNEYKAIVFWQMAGGMDSFNLIVPIDDCQNGKDMYAEYKQKRGSVALEPHELLNISTVGSNQVCDKFAVNYNFPVLQQLYNENDALFIANMGVMKRPITKHENWKVTLPILFAHNHMQKEAQSVDPSKKKAGTGVGGRLMDILKRNGYQTATNTVNGNALLNKGDSFYNNPSWTVSTRKFAALDDRSSVGSEMLEIIKELNGVANSDTSKFGETWSSRLAQSLFEYDMAKEVDRAVQSGAFDMSNYGDATTSIAIELKAVAQHMKSRHMRKVDREVYFVDQHGFDDHFSNNLAPKLADANAALVQFVDFLKLESIWQNTVVLMSSDFGRTVVPNGGGGTDHAWGGNYFMVGGGLKGGQIRGVYPADLSDKSDYWLRRGRMIPTTPYDAVWSAIATWMGVKGDTDLNFVLPTRPNFPRCELYTDEDLFEDYNVLHDSCQIWDEDGDGIADAYDACPGTEYWIDGNTVDGSGCFLPTPSPAPVSPAPTMTRGAIPVANVLDPASKIIGQGGSSYYGLSTAVDGTTARFLVMKNANLGSPGFIGVPTHGMKSIVHGIRIYMPGDNKNRDPVGFKIQGRMNRADPWKFVAEGPLSPPSDRNPCSNNDWYNPDVCSVVNSSPESPDNLLQHVEQLFYNVETYHEYRVTFPETRYVSQVNVAVGEVELVGRLIPDNWTPPPSFSPTTATPTTAAPTDHPTTAAPSVSMAPSSMPSLQCGSVFSEGAEKIVLWNNYDTDVTGKFQFNSVVNAVVPGYGNSPGAAQFTYTGDPGHHFPAIRQGVSYSNACLRGGMQLAVSFKAKLLNATTDTGIVCDPASDCPRARFRARQDIPAPLSGTYCNGWYWVPRPEANTVTWNANEWNTVSGIFTIPPACEGDVWRWFLFDITMGKPYAPGEARLVVDDAKVVIS